MTTPFPLPAGDYFHIRKRAIAFARTHEPKATFDVLKVAPAKRDELERFGTSGSAQYAEVIVRVQMTETAVNAAVERSRQSNSEQDVNEIRRFYGSPWDYRIVCTATNVIHHERMYCDICCGGDACCELPASSEPVVPADLYAPICTRAIRYALSDKRYTQADLLRFGPASESAIEHYGTIGSDRYGEAILRLNYSAEHVAGMVDMESRMRNPNPHQIREMFERPRGLRVVCTATDVVFHEWLEFA